MSRLSQQLKGLRRFLLSIRFGSHVALGYCDVAWSATLAPRKWRITIGARTRIKRGAIISCEGGDVSIGDRCSVNPYSVLYGVGPLKIGNGVLIAAHVVIIPGNHDFSRTDIPIEAQGSAGRGITIEDDVWIGAHVTILDGAHIARGCVIGAGSVVRGKTEPFGVYAGVPIRKLRSRIKG